MTRLGRFLWTAAAALTLWLGGMRSGVAAEVIQSFQATVVLAKDGELNVTERIRVHAEGSAIRHGIFRDLPLTFIDGEGRRHEVSFTFLDVTRDGKPEPYRTTHERGDVLRLYAGDQNLQLHPGDYTYVLRYRTARQVRWFDGKPELNWNVTGNFWTFPIAAASYRLELADKRQPIRWTAYTGPRGAHGTAWRGAVDADGILTVVTTQALRAGDGLTVVAALPEGAVVPPTDAELFWYRLVDNRAWIFSVLGFLFLTGYYLIAWYAVGRDPKRGTIIPQFHPPQGISPALANYIENWGFGGNKWRAFTAAALALAAAGRVRFDDSGGALTLKATGQEVGPGGGPGADREAAGQTQLAAGEGAIMEALLFLGGTMVIDKAHGKAVAAVGAKFTADVIAEGKNRFFHRNKGYVLAGAVMTCAVIMGIYANGGLSDADEQVLPLIAGVGIWITIFGAAAILNVSVRDFASLVRAAMALTMLGVFGVIAYVFIQSVVPDGLLGVLSIIGRFIAGHPLPFLLAAGAVGLNGLFVWLMRAPTVLGRQVMDQLAGLKLYLQTAEADRLNFQAPEITAERFEALLPYAVSLGVERPWSDAFAAALKRAHPDEADPTRHYRPTWSAQSWSGSHFSSAISGAVAQASGALSNAVPVSSGSSGFSSGGGGSGGGGGGGGGGGW
jgi:uncharacterized membrane protein YgcG